LLAGGVAYSLALSVGAVGFILLPHATRVRFLSTIVPVVSICFVAALAYVFFAVRAGSFPHLLSVQVVIGLAGLTLAVFSCAGWIHYLRRPAGRSQMA
jgi:hypothetical protein